MPRSSKGVDYDGLLYVEPGDLVTITYADPMPMGTHQAYSHIARQGVLTLTPGSDLVPGSPLGLVLLDPDQNNNPLAAEQASIGVTTAQLGVGGELVTLTEDGPNSGRFTGTLATMAYANCGLVGVCTAIAAARIAGVNDGVIALAQGGILQVYYTLCLLVAVRCLLIPAVLLIAAHS